MSYMSELAMLADEGGLTGCSIDEIVEAAKDVLAAPLGDEATEWVEWAKSVMELVDPDYRRSDA